MGNQPVTIDASTVIAWHVFLTLILTCFLALMISQLYYYKQLQKTNNWKDTVDRKLDNDYKILTKLSHELLALKLIVSQQSSKTKTNLQLITDKINEMNGYHNGKDEAPIVESVQGTEKTPVLQKETAPKEVVEGNETLPDNVIQFPGPKKPK